MSLFSDDTETPMSADVLQRLTDSGAITVSEIADLLNRAPSTAYEYLARTELRYGQVRTLFRHAGDDRVRDAFLANLLAGTRYIAVALEPHLDVNGDGDIDTRDAVARSIDHINGSAQFLKTLHDRIANTKTRPEVEQLDEEINLASELINEAAAIRNTLQYERDQIAARRKARNPLIGGGH